jgi:hypothetical protein
MLNHSWNGYLKQDTREDYKMVRASDVQRWDIYDIADDLADVQSLLFEAVDDVRVMPSLAHSLSQIENRLWAAVTRGGYVGPWPHYQGEGL